ncbi:MAG: glycoside hydrolase family 92 protein, partial [Muribaculaceae bacterium]|nr:glycoside hydrolase family 92 protein [Muribaculaceae bacterium]
IDVGNDKQLEVVAHNNSAENIYIQSVSFNGEPYDKSYIDYNQIKNGGKLEFVMGDIPSDVFGVSADARP